MQSLDEIMLARDASASAEPQPEPITDAERAANPIGAAQRERDEQGRFARQEAGEAEAQLQGDQPDQQRKSGNVPKQALEAERRKRQDRDDELATLRRELAELRGTVTAQRPQPTPQPVEAPPEFWTDPQAAVDYRLRGAIDPVRQQLETQRVQFSQMIAKQQHGDQAVNDAVQAFAAMRQSHPADFQRLDSALGSTADPVGDLVRWHKNQNALREIGDDPDAYRKRIREELMAELQGEAPQTPSASSQEPPRLPTSFAGRPSGGPRGGSGYGGPRALSDIMPRG